MNRLPAILLAFCLALAAAADTPPVPLAEARASLQRDLAAARQELAARHDAIRQERARLLASLHEQETAARNLELRAAALRQQREADRLAAARDEAQARRDEHTLDRLATAAIEARRTADSRLAEPEAIAILPVFRQLDDRFSSADPMLAASSLLEQLNLLAAAQESGRRVSAQALGPDRQVRTGACAVIGPLLYFAAPDGLAGIALLEEGSSLPVVYPPATPALAANIQSLVMGGGELVSVPVDPSLGQAIQLSTGRPSLMQHLRLGGVIMIPLLLLAVVCLAVAVYKFLSLARLGAGKAERQIGDILLALRQNRPAEAAAIARSMPRPLGPVLCDGLEHRDAPKEHIEEIMYERILAQVPALERLLSPLAVCASVAPLLGLLGTVTGMIHTFRLITVFGTGDPRVLSAGISEALITTEVGLAIAIPALLVHAYLSRRVRKAVAATQQSAIMFVNGLKLRLEEPGHE